MLPRVINLGPLTLHLYGLIIALSIYLGWLLAKKRASQGVKIPQKFFEDPILLIPLFLSIAIARIYHVIDYWSIYKSDLTSILLINRGGLGIWGALIGAIAGLIIVAKFKKLNPLTVLDLASPSLLLGQTLGRFGNYINQEGFGPPTSLPWGVFIEKLNRPAKYQNFSHFHPTFFYEAALDAIFLIVILVFAKNKVLKGQVFGLYLILYATGRFIVEFWRIDTATIGSLKIAHLLSIFTILIGLLIFRTTKKGLDPS